MKHHAMAVIAAFGVWLAGSARAFSELTESFWDSHGISCDDRHPRINFSRPELSCINAPRSDLSLA